MERPEDWRHGMQDGFSATTPDRIHCLGTTVWVLYLGTTCRPTSVIPVTTIGTPIITTVDPLCGPSCSRRERLAQPDHINVSIKSQDQRRAPFRTLALVGSHG